MRAVAALSHCVWLGHRRYEALSGATRGGGVWGARTLCTHIMNLGDGRSMGRHCDSVTASGAPTAAEARRKKEMGGRRDRGGGRRESKLSAEKKRRGKGNDQDRKTEKGVRHREKAGNAQAAVQKKPQS